jgi:hypothetical protein
MDQVLGSVPKPDTIPLMAVVKKPAEHIIVWLIGIH